MASKRKTSDEESIVLEPSTTQLPVVATTRTPVTTHPKKKKTSSKETSKKQTSIQSNGITQEEVKRSKDQKHRGSIKVKLLHLEPPKPSRSIRDVRADHVQTLMEAFAAVDPKTNTIQLYGNVVCDEDLEKAEIESEIAKEALKVEIIDGSHRYQALANLIADPDGNTAWKWNSKVEVIVYSNLTDQEARYLARLGNTQNAIQRPNTIYEFLKSFRRLNYEFFQVSDNLEVPVVDKIQAGKINQRFLAENPSIVLKDIHNIYKHFGWMSRAPLDVWAVVLQFIEKAENQEIHHIPKEKSSKAGGGATVKHDPPIIIKKLSMAAASLVKKGQVSKEDEDILDDNLKYMKLKSLLQLVVEKDDYSCVKEELKKVGKNDVKDDDKVKDEKSSGEEKQADGSKEGVEGDTGDDDRQERTDTETNTLEPMNAATQADSEVKISALTGENEILKAEIVLLKEEKRLLTLEHNAVMLGDPNNKVFVDQERILYLGGNIDVKQKQLLVVRIIGAFIVSPDELYELGDKVKKSRTELYYVGRAEQVRSARGKYVLTADTVEVLKSHLHA